MYEKVKNEIVDIISIVKECPENLQEKCFEIMLKHLLDEVDTPKLEKKDIEIVKSVPLVSQTNDDDILDPNDAEMEIVMNDLHMKTRNFMKQNNISLADINAIYYKEGTLILPLYEDLGTTNMADGQIIIALLTALENSFSTGEYTFNREIIRSRCKEFKCYDGSNFTSIFKRHASLFDDFESYSKDDEIKLSTEGKKELAKIILKIARG